MNALSHVKYTPNFVYRCCQIKE